MTWLETIAAVAVGGGITTGGQAALEAWRTRREWHGARSATEAAKRQVAAELWSIKSALQAVADGENTFVHLLSRRARWDELSTTLAGDDDYLTIDAAYALAEAVDRNLERLDGAARVREASGALEQVQIAYRLLDPDGKLTARLRQAIANRAAEVDAQRMEQPPPVIGA